MIYPYTYKNKTLVVQINDDNEPLGDIDVTKFVTNIQKLNTCSMDTTLIDLHEKSYFNSSDLGALIKIKDSLFDAGITLKLLNPSESILELLNIVGLNDFFGIDEKQK
ncbi:MAG TPA: STAS domain-containing protein [Spirochaetota bacterium]|nr:STAS domain-containing protein [Spirochaetota bacterium]HQO01941.1 STAS domain-containing protein [Spirochaetota bacterium]HQP47772.1 STAS domain-containing protein [Spirochaetota bacterium]